VVLKALDLRDVALVVFSMGTGEVTRYIGTYGTDRVRKAVLIGTLGPYLAKALDNLEGVDPSVFGRHQEPRRAVGSRSCGRTIAGVAAGVEEGDPGRLDRHDRVPAG
jgi:pimeloyl-ACP methyl ester carboxylesterase